MSMEVAQGNRAGGTTVGKLARFHCSVCDFEATNSGGGGQRYDNPSVTMHCHDCKQLFEVALPVVPWGGEIVIRSNPLQCPKSGDHQVEKWKHPGPCPRCGTQLDREEIAEVPDAWPEGM